MYTLNSLKNYLDTVLVREKVPGFDCMVLHEGREIFRYFAGCSDKENNIEMTGKEHFFLYSASKPITCAAALHAFEEGKFLLSHPVWWYLNEYKDCMVKIKNEDGTVSLVPQTQEMRIRDLFSMSAGLDYNTESEFIKAAAKKNPNATTREIVRAIAKHNLDFQPGTNWQYSLCHDVLAALVEVATGEKFCDYVKRVIFDPLGMNDTRFYHKGDNIDDVCAQYRFNHAAGIPERVPTENAYIFTTNYDSGGAGIISTVEDYAKFAAAMANYGKGINGARILSRASVNLMRTNVLKDKAYDSFSSWMNNLEYGYGCGVRTKICEGRGGNLCSMGEFGWDGAAGFLCSFDPEKNLAIIYAQHVLNPLHEIIHPKIKNFVNQVIE